jgi:hypothetical protein
MTTVVITPQKSPPTDSPSAQRMRVSIHIDSEILAAEAAILIARGWLEEHISELLGVATPELIVDDNTLYWRFEVMLGIPNKAQPGSGALYSVGHILLDAATGAVMDAEARAAELRVHVASIAP